MRSIQLDKNAGGKKLRDACNEEGIVCCTLLPEAFRDADDPDIAALGFAKGHLTLTFDRGFLREASSVLVKGNPGVLLVRADTNTPFQVSTKTAPKLLRQFKRAFPEWSSVSWENSCVELTPTLVIVYNSRTNPPIQTGVLDRNTPHWQVQLKQLLEANAGQKPNRTAEL